MRKLLLLAMVLVPCAAFGAGLSLADKARVFEADLVDQFTFDGQVMCKKRVPQDEGEPPTFNMPDNAYMTGIHLGTLSMKYAVTGDPADREAVRNAIGALDLLCTVSGKPGLLARAAVRVDDPFDDDGIWRTSDDGEYRWRGDVSSDQMTGVYYGFALAHDLAAAEADKAVIARNVTALTDHLLDNGLRIIGYDDEPTQWGSYFPDYVKNREPMNALLLLQHLKVAAHVTGETRFADAYQKYAVDEGYADIAVSARRMPPPGSRGGVNHSDDVLIYLAYVPLLMLEDDAALRDKYLASLRRTWDGAEGVPGTRAEANPFYTFIVKRFLDDTIDVGPATDTLRWFPFDLKWNRNTRDIWGEEFGLDLEHTIQSPEPASGATVPIDRRPRTWSAWVQNPFRAGTRDADEGMEYNGHDYLMAYWLGRYAGYIDGAH